MKSKVIKATLICIVLLVNFFSYKKIVNQSLTSLKGKNLVSHIKLGRLWGNFDKLRTEAIEFSGWSKKDNIDLSLDPQTKGKAIYKFLKPPEAKKIILQLALSFPRRGTNRVRISTDQKNWQAIVEKKGYHFSPFDLTSIIKDSSQFFVMIEAENNNPITDKSKPSVILYDFYLMFYQKEFILPPILLMLSTLFFPILFILKPKSKNTIKLSLLFIVFGIGLQLSINNLNHYLYRSFDSDVICLTQEMPRFLSMDSKSALLGNYCGNKESVIMLILLFFFNLFGTNSEIALRLSSLIFHLLTIGLVFMYGKKIKSFTTGLIASLFIGTHAYLVQLSARGLRDSAFTFALTLLIFFIFEANYKKIIAKISFILTSLFLVYLRLHSLFQIITIVPVLAVCKRIKKSPYIRQSLFIIITLILISFPIINHNLKTYDTWNYSEQMHLKWNANVEFAGKPGFPSKESVAINPFQGPPISPFTYFFKLHTIPDLIKSTIGGIIKTFQFLYFKKNIFGFFIFLYGGWLMVKTKKNWYIPFLVFYLEMPHFFLATKNLVEYRSMTHSLPFIGLTIGFAIDKILTKLKKFKRAINE